MQFQCNICGAANEFQPGGFERDDSSCTACGSSVRLRALLDALTMEIFGIHLTLADIPPLKAIRGIGLSDEDECGRLLGQRFDYRNTYYHTGPRFDIAAPPVERGIYDFILAGDVFEHVAPPVEDALANACALLKPHGFLALTVPYSVEETTREHFAELHDFSLVNAGGHVALVNRTRSGEWQVFENLVFHGGHGSVLELREFSEKDLLKKLADAGFGRVRMAAEEYPAFGIAHREAWSLPVIAGKEPFHLEPDGMAELMRQHATLKDIKGKLAAELKRLEGEYAARTAWALDLDARLTRLQGEFDERTRWALALDRELEAEVERRVAEAARLNEELNQERFRVALWGASRWSRLGRALGLGPKV